MGDPVGGRDPGAQQGVADLVAAAHERHRDQRRRRHPVAGGEHRADQHLGRQPVGAVVADRDQHEQVRRERAGGVGDLGELRAVQRAVGDHAEHPAGRQELAHLGRPAPQALERALVAVAESGGPGRRRRTSRRGSARRR